MSIWFLTPTMMLVGWRQLISTTLAPTIPSRSLSLSLFPFLSLLWIWLKMKLKHVFGCVGGLCAKCIGFSSACTTGWPESKVYLCWTGKFVGPIDISHFKETKILTFTGLIDENPHTSVIMLGFSYLGPIWWII